MKLHKEDKPKDENKNEFKKYIIKVINEDNKEESVQVINGNEVETSRKQLKSITNLSNFYQDWSNNAREASLTEKQFKAVKNFNEFANQYSHNILKVRYQQKQNKFLKRIKKRFVAKNILSIVRLKKFGKKWKECATKKNGKHKHNG